MQSSLLRSYALSFLHQALGNVFLHLYQISALPLFLLQGFLSFLYDNKEGVFSSSVAATTYTWIDNVLISKRAPVQESLCFAPLDTRPKRCTQAKACVLFSYAWHRPLRFL